MRSTTTVHPVREPVDNTHIERFNGRFREECFNQRVFRNLLDALQKIEA